MPIPHIPQPDILPVDDTLRLRKYDGESSFALAWYQDPETVYLVDGVREPYTPEKLRRMYEYLDRQGELYWIEQQERDRWLPIGDVTFWQTDMPIVIGDPARRGRGIGRRVIRALIERGKDRGYRTLWVDEIYRWNEGSRRCFESLGFRACEATEKGNRFRLDLSEP